MSVVDRKWLGLVLVGAVVPLLGADPPTVPAPAPPPPEAPAAAPVAAPTGAEVLSRCTKLMEVGLWEEALEVSLPAISTYPELARSFEAVATIAADQLARAVTPPVASPSVVYRPADAPPVVYRSPTARTRRKAGESSFRWGFDLGFPSGVRAEWHIARTVVTDVGLRAGGNLMFYDGVNISSDVTGFVDWRLAKQWDLETSVGTVVYFGYPYAVIGAAAQYDPEGPLQVQAGGRIGPYGMFVPEASISFVW